MTRDLEGWLTDAEGRWYAALAAAIPAGGTLVEVGAWKGRSASYAGPICTARGVRFVLVDHFRGSTDAYAPLYAERLAREDVRAILTANLRALAIEHELLAIPSLEAARSFAPSSIDAVFLDASHDRESVRADLDAWWPAIARHGVIAGHDFDHPDVAGEVRTFADSHGLALSCGPDRAWLARR